MKQKWDTTRLTHKKQKIEIVSVPAYRLGVFQGGNCGPSLSAGKRKKRKDGGNKTKQNKKLGKNRARNNTPLSQGDETVGFLKRTAGVCLNHKLTLSVCVSLSLPRSLTFRHQMVSLTVSLLSRQSCLAAAHLWEIERSVPLSLSRSHKDIR